MQDLLIANLSSLSADPLQHWISERLAPEMRWSLAEPGALPDPAAIGPDGGAVLVVYDPLERAALAALTRGDDLAAAIADWEQTAGAVLKLWKARRQNVMLAAADLFSGDAAPLCAMLGRRVALRETVSPAPEAEVAAGALPVWRLIAGQPRLLSRRLRRLCDELAAGGPVRPPVPEDMSVLFDAVNQQTALAARASEADRLARDAEDLRREAADLSRMAEGLRGETGAKGRESAALQQEAEALRKELAALRAEAETLRAAADLQRKDDDSQRREAEARHEQIRRDHAALQQETGALRQSADILRQEAESLRRALREAEATSVERVAAVEAHFIAEIQALEQRRQEAVAGTARFAEEAEATGRAAKAAAQAAAAALREQERLRQEVAMLTERAAGFEEMAERDFRTVAELEEARRQLAELELARSQIEMLDQQMQLLQATHAGDTQQIAALADESRVMREQALAQERRVAELYASTSWRITAPLRATRRLLKD